MKRMIAFALAVMLAFGMTACGDNTSSGTQSASSASAPGASPLIPDGPAPEINLITGEALAEGLAAGDRPVAVMVNNAQAALPQRRRAASPACLRCTQIRTRCPRWGRCVPRGTSIFSARCR